MSAPLMLGRKPVFDDKLEVVAYQLPCSDGGQGEPGGTTATPEVLLRVGLDGDLSRVVGAKRAFVSVEGAHLVGAEAALPSPAHTVVQLERTVAAADPDVLDRCRRLVEQGYHLAADSRLARREHARLVEMVSFVRFDAGGVDPGSLADEVGRCRSRGITAVAGGVESRARMESLRDVGFALFEGHMLSRPVDVLLEALTPSRITCVRLVEKVCDPETGISEIEELVEADPGLGYRLLHVAGLGSADGMRRPVRSVREAVVLLGRDRLYSWLLLLLMSDANRGSAEQLTIALTRAKMCNLVAGSLEPGMADSAFTVGLVSALDLLLGATLEDIVSRLSITRELVRALRQRAGTLGAVLDDVLGWELGSAVAGLRAGVDPLELERHYLAALAWATDVCRAAEAGS